MQLNDLCLDEQWPMNLTYNLNRQQAADLLGVSTRTIDRYVKKGKLSYKKVANKVLLAQEEIDDLQKEFDLLHQQEAHQVTTERYVEKDSSKSLSTGQQTWSAASVKEFAEILDKKDKVLEEKNQLIYMLQHKIWELETQMNQMVALPDHSEQKEQLQKEIQTLNLTKQELENQVRKEKLWNTIFLRLIAIAAAMIIFFIF